MVQIQRYKLLSVGPAVIMNEVDQISSLKVMEENKMDRKDI